MGYILQDILDGNKKNGNSNNGGGHWGLKEKIN